jgi:hypothetical protein
MGADGDAVSADRFPCLGDIEARRGHVEDEAKRRHAVRGGIETGACTRRLPYLGGRDGVSIAKVAVRRSEADHDPGLAGCERGRRDEPAVSVGIRL